MSIPSLHEQFLSYYRGLMAAGGGDIPRRDKVRPFEIKQLLPWITMAERKGPYHMVPTVIGSAIDDVLHINFTGINLFDHMPENLAARMDAFYGHIMGVPCGGHIVRTLATANGLLRGYHSTQLPLRGKSGELDRLIGFISVSSDEPLLSEFGQPNDIQSVDIMKEDYIDLGFGLP